MLAAIGRIESNLGAPALALNRHTPNLMAVRTQKHLAAAQGTLPREKTQKRQDCALDKTNPVEPSKFLSVTASAHLLHKLK